MKFSGGRHRSRHTAFPAAVMLLISLLLASLLFVVDAEAVPPPQESIPEVQNSEIVLLLELDGDAISDSFVAVERDGRIFIPICLLAETVSLAIKCSEDSAFGFVLAESRPLVIDLKEGYAISTREAYRLKGTAFGKGGEVYADMEALSKWLPIDFEYSPDQSILKMHAREVLPAQGFKKRQKNKRPPAVVVKKSFPDSTLDRAAATIPTLDFTSQAMLSGEGKSRIKTDTFNYVSLSGDLLHMSGDFRTWAKNDELKQLDFTLSRRSDNGIGRLPLKQIALGAFQPPGVDGIGAATSSMYGVFLSNRPLTSASAFLTHDVNGLLPPGWDAELFQNGSLIAYQPPTESDRYHFDNIHLQYGLNVFNVVLHGPFGETRELEQQIVSDATTPHGDFLYTMSAGWQTGLTSTERASSQQTSNITMTSDFGVSKNLTASALFVSEASSVGDEKYYAGVALRTALGYSLLSLEMIQSFSAKFSEYGELVTLRSSSGNLFGNGLQLEQRFFRNFDSPRFPLEADAVLSHTVIKWSAFRTGWRSMPLPYSLQLGLDAKESGKFEWESIFRVMTGWGGWNGALESDVSYHERLLTAASMFQISTRFRDMTLRGQFGVTISPELQATEININADKDLGNGLQLSTAFLHDPNAHTSGVRAGLSKRFGLIGYSISAIGSTTGAYSINLGVSTSLASDAFNRQSLISAEPLSPSGMVSVSASTVTVGGAPGKEVPGVAFLVNGSPAITLFGSKGLPVIAFLQPDIPVDVTVDMTTIEDPFMVPLEQGCHIIPRAGVVSACKFTMITGGEIDGMVLAHLNQYDEVPLKEVRVDLISEEPEGTKVQASTRTQESGYYLFKTVKPGIYTIEIPKEELARLKAAAVPPIRVTMPVGGDLVSGKDFSLNPAGGDNKDVTGSKVR